MFNPVQHEQVGEEKETRMSGYLHKLEQRPIIGLMRKKYWFVLPSDAPVLYWYNSPSDFNSAGRIVLSGAAFTFNPREYGIFEVHVDSKCYVLEAPDNKIRFDWLSSLQFNRKQYYQIQNSGNDVKEFALEGNSDRAAAGKNSNSSPQEQQLAKDQPGTSNQQSAENGERPLQSPIDSLKEEAEPRSTFYLREDGELHPGSLEVPPLIHNINSIEDLLNKVSDETQQLELPTKKLFQKTRNSLRTMSQSSHGCPPNLVFPQPKDNCDRCAEFLQALEQLRNRCYELTDDLVVYQELVTSLKRSLHSAHNERDALQRYCIDASSDMDRLAFVIEREHALTKMQLTVSQLWREVERLKTENRTLETENSSLKTTVEAYQESVKTKEELILRFAEQQTNGGCVVGKKFGSSPSQHQRGGLGGSSRTGSQPIPFCTSPQVTEALLVDFGTPTDIGSKSVFMETAVNDLNEMQDLIDGYKNQNKFLNNEVVELQRIIHALEDRERRLIRQNFSMEAFYYQLKSKYIMLLNHFRSSDQPKRVIEPTVIQDMIDEVSRPHSPMRLQTARAVETMSSSSALSSLISNPQGIPMGAFDDFNNEILRPKDPETDSLGFYLSSPRSRKAVFQQQPPPNRVDTIPAGNDGNNQQQQTAESSPVGEGSSANLGIIEEREQQEEGGEQQQKHLPSISHSLSSPTAMHSASNCHSNNTSQQVTVASTVAVPATSAPSTSSYFAYFSELVEKPVQPPRDPDWLLRLAADSQKRSNDIFTFIEPGNNQEFVEWLERWDSFLVNHVLQPMKPQPELKALVRSGIPHAYRNRVWAGLVEFLVGPCQVETGKGYYECLLRKSQRLNSEEDAALKQIDLDLTRTLPNNKLFETEQSPKAGALKNILYAFRFHNKNVEYCQGLNRLGAIGLLYLEESQAFWFLVACVEHLQPPNYYSSNLVGAVIDQRVLLDLVQDRLPSLYAHLQRLEVNLSLFTLSWFLTVFVDVLSHSVYIKIFDVFLYEGNKVLFRFALAILRLVEPRLLECTSFSGVHTCLSGLSTLITDYKVLAKIAFNSLNPFPAKQIESRRQNYYLQHKNGKFKI